MEHLKMFLIFFYSSQFHHRIMIKQVALKESLIL